MHDWYGSMYVRTYVCICMTWIGARTRKNMYVTYTYTCNHQVHNFMSARLPSAANLANQVKSVLTRGTPRKKWPVLAQLPGEIRNPAETKHRPNFVAYQVRMKAMHETSVILPIKVTVSLF